MVLPFDLAKSLFKIKQFYLFQLKAKSVAGEAGVPYFHASGSDFDDMFVGSGARKVRSLFKAARDKAPCVIFIDEIDSVGSSRTKSEFSLRQVK